MRGMNVRRLITTVATTSAILVVAAPGASALDTAAGPSALAQAAAVGTRAAMPAVSNAVGDKLGGKLHAVQSTVTAGADAVTAVHELTG